MWPWNKTKKDDGEREIILKGFPSWLADEIAAVFDIIPLDHNVEYRFGQTVNIDKLIRTDKQTIYLDGEILEIPSRVYFDEPDLDKENKLNEIQKSILNSIYLTHHNGFIRQKRLQLLSGKNDYFLLPYKFNLLGEYVVEILEDLQNHINDETIGMYVKFAIENEKYFLRMESKMAGSWNTNYRSKFRDLKNYIGRQNIDRIKKRMPSINHLR